jgi:hypothetical protein
MIFPQPKLTKKIKSITKYPNQNLSEKARSLGSFLKTRELLPIVVRAFEEKAYQLTALTKKARNRNWARRRGTP